MELRQLKYFIAVGEELSFSRAAQRCYVSQSAISLQISKLEREIGEPLFDRTSRSVQLTAVGAQLISIARHMIELEQSALALSVKKRNQLRLTANMTFSAHALAAIAAVREQHHDAEIDFVLKQFSEQIDAVAAGDCDVALIRGGVERPGLRVTELWTENLIVAFSDRNPLADKDAVALSDLVDYPLLLPRRNEQVLLHRVVEKATQHSGLHLTFGPPVAPDHTVTAELLNHPDCWTILYASTAAGTPTNGLVFRTEYQRRLVVPVCAVVNSSAPVTDIQQRLIEALAATAPE